MIKKHELETPSSCLNQAARDAALKSLREWVWCPHHCHVHAAVVADNAERAARAGKEAKHD